MNKSIFDFMTAEEAIIEMEKYIPNLEKENKSISQRNIAWHLDHSMRVFLAICAGLNAEKSKEYRPKWSLGKTLVMASGYIPRGKGRAPKIVMNEEEITKESLKKLIQKVKRNYEAILKLPKNSYFSHPYFGPLNMRKTRRFLGIHTNHHVKIIKEILA